MDILSTLLMPLLNMELLFLIDAGTFAGIYVGAIPRPVGDDGRVDPDLLHRLMGGPPTLALMIGIYMGGDYGGSARARSKTSSPRNRQQRGRRRCLHPDDDSWHPRRCGHRHHDQRAVHPRPEPRPVLMIEQPDMFWSIVRSLALANCFRLLSGLTGIRLLIKIVELPRTVLPPVIMVLSIVGAYTINNSLTDVYWMLGFGGLGYFMRLYGYPLAPIILGVILSRLLDDNWRRAIISERKDFGAMMMGIFTDPLSVCLFLTVVMILVANTPWWLRGRARKAIGQTFA